MGQCRNHGCNVQLKFVYSTYREAQVADCYGFTRMRKVKLDKPAAANVDGCYVCNPLGAIN